MSEHGSLCVNVGCGSAPTPGWLNFDNSPTVLLARAPFVSSALERAGLLGSLQRSFLVVAMEQRIAWANAAQRIPLPDGSARVIYSSHMIEHLDRASARGLLTEARRVLRPGGVVRIVAPDLKRLARAYVDGGDADHFVAATLLAHGERTSLGGRLKTLALGRREHAWMYDEVSLVTLVRDAGFDEVRALDPGVTTIPDPGPLNLHERSGESIYVEGRRP